MSGMQRDMREPPNPPNCQRARRMLDGWLDGELDPATSAEIAQHITQCPDCLALRSERERLRTTLRASAPRYAAPAALRELHAQPASRAAAAEPAPPISTRVVSWWQALLMAGAASAATALVTIMLVHAPGDQAMRDAAHEAALPLREQVVTRHVASLSGAHLIDVASSDSHVVKPWFQGKIDFAPMVRDLSKQGFILLGARQERIAGRPALAVVYKIRNHPVNLFIWREPKVRDAALSLTTVRGFSVGAWAAGGLEFAAVSDVEAADLERFAGELQSVR